MRPNMKNFFFIVLLMTVLAGFGSENRDFTQWWLYNYGDYKKDKGKNDPRVEWAYKVFERLKNAADKDGGRPPRLFIIDTRGEPYAQSLPDGGIIISPTALDFCYTKTVPVKEESPEKEEGDRRLAFILGHELAHLGNKDYIHREAFQALEEPGETHARKELSGYFKLSGPEKTKTFKKNELLADQKGAIYAAMAGYDMSELCGNNNNFFKYWARQTGIGYFYDDNPRHPSYEKRAQFIRLQLKAVAKKVELFKAGVLLYQLGNEHDGAAAFLEFAREYPSREVFNNIGACYFHLAMGHLYLKYREVYYKFRLSTPIDYSTTAAAIQPRGEEDYLKDRDFSRYITKAEDYFKMAVERDQTDKTVRCNLAAVFILKKENARAQAECDFILKKDPRDVDALNNKAIAFYYYGKEEDLDTTQKAIHILEKAHRLEPGNDEVLYNLASLKEDRNRFAGAKSYWEKYLQLDAVPRDNFYHRVCEKLGGTVPPGSGNRVPAPRIPPGIRLGEDFFRLEKRWGQGHTIKYKVSSEEGENNQNWSIDLQVMVKDKTRVLALDGTVEIVEQESATMEGIQGILKRWGPPPKIVRHTNGKFYIYRERGFSVKEIDGKVCSYTWYEKSF